MWEARGLEGGECGEPLRGLMCWPVTGPAASRPTGPQVAAGPSGLEGCTSGGHVLALHRGCLGFWKELGWFCVWIGHLGPGERPQAPGQPLGTCGHRPRPVR